MANPSKPNKPSNPTTPEAFISEAAPAATPEGLGNPAPESEAPNSQAKVLEAPNTKPVPTDPFVLISRAGSTDKVARSLRAMAVPGGVVLKSTFAVIPEPVPKGEALCFIPGVELKDLQVMLP